MLAVFLAISSGAQRNVRRCFVMNTQCSSAILNILWTRETHSWSPAHSFVRSFVPSFFFLRFAFGIYILWKMFAWAAVAIHFLGLCSFCGVRRRFRWGGAQFLWWIICTFDLKHRYANYCAKILRKLCFVWRNGMSTCLTKGLEEQRKYTKYIYRSLKWWMVVKNGPSGKCSPFDGCTAGTSFDEHTYLFLFFLDSSLVLRWQCR